jgi:negative regulator of sigma E activity
MNDFDDKLSEQLCAWMDGELSADEARFLEKRLANDPALCAKWERLQLASACLKGHALRPMPAALAQGVASALGESASATPRRPWLGWAVAASVALLAVAISPRWRPADGSASSVASAVAVLPDNPVASPASADLVAPLSTAAARAASASVATAAAEGAGAAAMPDPVSLALTTEPKAPESPMPLGAAASPADFPLIETAVSKSWPRSPLAAPASDPALEAYLVRHNELSADAALGGFVPYVDVVTRDKSDAGDEAVAEDARR